MAGYVYLIGTPIFHWFKIGKSINPEIRIQDLGILLPFKIRVIGIWKAENHHALESELHDKYKYCRINGEWFRFEHKEVSKLFTLLPSIARVYPSENSPDSVFAKFSNIESDCPEGKRIRITIKKKKTNGGLSQEEQLIFGQTCGKNKHLPEEERKQLARNIIIQRRQEAQQKLLEQRSLSSSSV